MDTALTERRGRAREASTLRQEAVGAPSSMLRTCRERGTTALLVHSDREAVGIVAKAHDEGLRVPEDLAVVAYDDELAAAGDPPLTAVRTT